MSGLHVQLYSWTARLNYLIYNAMLLMAIAGFLNHVTVRFGHFIGLRDKPLGAELKDNLKFDLKQVD